MRDCIGIAGLLLTLAGIAMISRPAALIVAGVALILCALFDLLDLDGTKKAEK